MPEAARRPWLLRILPYAWVSALLVLPLLLVARISISQSVLAQPPYVPVFDAREGLRATLAKLGAFTLDSYRGLADEPLYLASFAGSLRLAALATLVMLPLAFGFAYSIATAALRHRALLLGFAMAPFWTSFLIRVYALTALIRNEGPLERLLAALGLIVPPLDLFASDAAVVLGIVYSYLPFMVLPIYTALERRDPALLEAARDLGAGPIRAFATITLPLAVPGVFAGVLLVFIPAVGEFVIPDLLGGSDTLMIGRMLWNDFFANHDWPAASAVAVVLLALLAVPIWAAERRAAVAADAQ